MDAPRTFGQLRDDDGNADRAGDVAHQCQHRRTVGAQIVGQRQERHRAQRHEHQPEPETLRHAYHKDFGNAGLVGPGGHVEQREAGDAQPAHDQRARLDIAHHPAYQHHRDERAAAAACQQQARGDDGIADDVLQVG